ncbi:hypothetical protein YPPY47_2976, partial [Yersinia pestis PY-47]
MIIITAGGYAGCPVTERQ